MSRIAAGLEAGKLPEGYAAKMLVEAETQLGYRCHGCGRRITTGFEFVKLAATVANGIPTVDRLSISACNGGKGGDCDFAEEARKDATVVRMIEFAWLSPDPALELKTSPDAAGTHRPASSSADQQGEAASASGEDASANGGVELPAERRTRAQPDLHPPDHLSEEEKAAGADGK